MGNLQQSGTLATHTREGLWSSPRSPLPTSTPFPRLAGGSPQDDQTHFLPAQCSCHRGTCVGGLNPGISSL